ncbi:MAG: MarR family winged helix-turn-helix transcriptional regulator [Thermoleophilia bacterium]
MFHQAVADRLGLNPTDHKCLLFLMDGPRTAGELAGLSGLTTGAITAAVDRLEAAGYVRRVHDARDRRRVLVEIVPETVEGVVKLFAPLGRAMANLESGYSRQQLDLIRDYLDRAGYILYQETLRLKKGTKH